MFSHVFIGVADFDRAIGFYAPLMAVLNLPQRFRDDSRPWADGSRCPGRVRCFSSAGHSTNSRPPPATVT